MQKIGWATFLFLKDYVKDSVESQGCCPAIWVKGGQMCKEDDEQHTHRDRRFIRFTKDCECDDHNMNTLQMYMDINSKSNALALHRRITLTIHSRNTKAASSMFHRV